MIKKKSFLSLYLIISFVLIVSAVIVSLTAGLNLGTDIGGGTQFEISVESNVSTNQHIKNVKHVLKEHGVVAEKIFVEDKYVDSVIVVRVADKKIDNQAQIKKALVEKLDIYEDDISSFETINGSVTKKAVLYTSITVVCVLILLFVAAWIRYNLVSGLSLMFVVLHTLMLSISMFAITRLPITMFAIISILCVAVLVVFAFILFLEKIKENSALKQNESLSTLDLVDASQKSVLKPLVFLVSMIALVALCFVCVPVRYVCLSALSVVVGLVVAAYSYNFVGVTLHEKLLDIKVHADKRKLSKNQSPEPTKTSNRTLKKKTNTENK